MISLLAVSFRRGRKNMFFIKTIFNFTIAVLAVSPRRGWKYYMNSKAVFNFTICVLAVSPNRGCKKTQNHKVGIAFQKIKYYLLNRVPNFMILGVLFNKS